MMPSLIIVYKLLKLILEEVEKPTGQPWPVGNYLSIPYQCAPLAIVIDKKSPSVLPCASPTSGVRA